jgi:hypothetical protein
MPKSERTEVIEFLRKHIIGRTVVAEANTTSEEGGRLAVAYQDQTSFNNLVETADGFSFDLTALFRGTRFVKDDGRGFLAEGTLDAIRVYRYKITERKSSGKLVGYARFVASTNPQNDPFSGACFVSRISLAGGELVVEDTQAGYCDFVLSDGSFKPVASDGKYRYAAEHGKLVVYYQQATFDVDPETMGRTRPKDKLPLQVSREIDFTAIENG